MAFFKRSARMQNSIFLEPLIDGGIAAEAPSALFSRPRSMASKTGMIAFILVLPIVAGLTANRELLERPDARPLGGIAAVWKASPTAYQNGKELFSTFPSGRFSAGMNDSLLLVLQQPPDTLLNKALTVTATFWKGGDKIVVANGQTVTPRNQSGGQTRIVLPEFGLPLAGLWRIDVQLGGQTLGHTVLDVPDFPWTLSPRRNLVRNPGWIERNVAMEGPEFIPGVSNEYTWYLLAGRKLSGSFKVEGIEQGTEKRRVLFEAPALGEPAYGASATAKVKLSLPKPGIWRLTAFVNGKVFGSLVVEAK